MAGMAGAAGSAGRSVSELYAADEVELLLEELRELERPAGRPRPEEIQDFEIAGSQTGWSVRSWDSHAVYGRAAGGRPARLAPLYCRAGHLLEAAGAARLVVLVCSVTCAALEWGAAPRLYLLPLSLTARLRPLLAVALFAALASAALLFLDVSRLLHLFPFNWAKLNAWLYVCVGSIYVITSSVVLAAVTSEEYWWISQHTIDMLIAAGSFGLIGGLMSGITSVIYCYQRPLQASTSVLLAPASPSPLGTPHHSPSPSPPTTRRTPAYLPVPVEPDPLPCSSKTPL